MSVLVTGSTGFLGTAVVRACLDAGLTVRALVRPGTDVERLPWAGHPGLQVARGDLRRRAGLVEALDGVDTVVHLAAVKSGDFATRFAGTVVTTENLLAAMDEAGTGRLVHCSSFSVYKAGGVRPGGLLDESAPVEDRPLERDEYAQVKLVQEEQVRAWRDAAPGRELTVLRPGLIHGPGELWHALLGVELLPSVWIGAGRGTVLPMAWVDNVADAFAAAAALRPLADATLNLVDDDLPTVARYVAAVRPLVEAPPRVLPFAYPVVRAGVRAVAALDRRLLGGRLKLPSGLSPGPFEARFRPLRYSNAAARAALGWTPRVDLAEALERSQR